MKLEDIDKSRVPQHVAIIMDGNGRWAQKQAHKRIFGHQNAMTAVRQAVEAAVACGVKYLTLYTFTHCHVPTCTGVYFSHTLPRIQPKSISAENERLTLK